MARCSGIRVDGGRCGAQAIRGEEHCVNHHPDYEGTRRSRNSKGGKRGGRGRPTSELHRLKARFEELADQVLAGKIERSDGAVAGQLLNGARACIKDALDALPQEQLIERVEQLERSERQRRSG
jgi:hypothetical protein